MTKPLIQIGDEIREMNQDEYAQHLNDSAELQAQEQERAAKADARQAVLNKLGLSAEEAAALLG
jgi:hypothetical protein